MKHYLAFLSVPQRLLRLSGKILYRKDAKGAEFRKGKIKFVTNLNVNLLRQPLFLYPFR
jgi:hypothetical protein